MLLTTVIPTTPRERATKEEWRDPDDVSYTMLFQGVSTRNS